MKQERPGQTKLHEPGTRIRLEALRSGLLKLHKALVDSERVQYEKVMGPIQSPSRFLQLLTNDPWFAWLSPLSQLIVTIDEVLDAKEPLSEGAVAALTKQSANLLVASESGLGFSKHYDEALQRDPDVVMAHSVVARLHRPPT